MSIETFTPGINLSNNLLGSESDGILTNFFPMMASVVQGDPFENIKFIDLSFNFITAIPKEIEQLKALQSLYIHRNFIYNM